jgi:hypothetical protein
MGTHPSGMLFKFSANTVAGQWRILTALPNTRWRKVIVDERSIVKRSRAMIQRIDSIYASKKNGTRNVSRKISHVFGCRSVRRPVRCQNSRRGCAKHDSGFNLKSLPVLFVRPEPPLLQGIANHLLLLRIRAQKVDVPHLA